MGVEPTRSWNVGELRTTPNGKLLEGVYSNSYWYLKLTADGEGLSSTCALEDALRDVAARFDSHRRFFAEICDGGGKVELFVGLFGESNFGIELQPALLCAIESMYVTLSFDIYPSPQNW